MSRGERMSEQRAPETGDLFIHLRVHSAYSLLEGAVAVKALPKLCGAHGMPAVGIADTDNFFGALEFSEVLSDAGVQPVMGCQMKLDYAPQLQPGDKPTDPAPIVLYAQSEEGWLNLAYINSHAYLESPDADPIVSWSALEGRSGGVICLTGGPRGPVGMQLQAGQRKKAEQTLDRLAEAFPDRLYVEIHRHGSDGALRTGPEEATEAAFVDMADARGLPLVAINEVYFPKAELFEAHDAMLCIADGRYVSEEDRRRLTEEFRFKAPAEMLERFRDLPDAIESTVEIARRCAFRPKTHAPILPKFADDEVAELRRLAWEGLESRLEKHPPAVPRAEYDERLEYELGIIERMGFPGYFLIVADFIQWAKEHDIPVGPGRGSGAGSLVAYVLTITNLDPLRYSLLFERFLNPERVSMPDFDIDFCQDRREEVIKYVQEKYGRDRVAQIITFGKLQARAALRDVGRVLQMPYGQVDRICKLVPNDPGKPTPLDVAIQNEPRLQEEAEKEFVVSQLLDVAQKIEGLYRHASTHAAGVVIGDRPLEQLVPLYRDPRSDMPVTQFNMKWVEPAGLVKFDFLGLKTLTVIQNAIDLIKLRGETVDIEAIPIDDKKTYELYSRADTVAVFQVESQGMRDALRQLQPTCIEDIIALVALYRPGPMENIPKYCNVKHGKEQAEYLHPMLEPILKETQGIIVYQEQVMQIAQKMANYSLGGADLLRRAMGKKIKEAMDAERPKFLKGAAENGVDADTAQAVFDLLEKFANYGFNKSHAAAYGYVSYQTGWLKANYPVEFMAAVMNLDIQYTEKLAVYRQELDRMEIELLPPDVNASFDTFTVEYEDGPDGQRIGKVRYALGALKNVGGEAMKAIAEERMKNGRFTDLFDFARRCDLKMIGKRAIEMLARAGAFDGLAPRRRQVFQSVETLVGYSAAEMEQLRSSQNSLFGASGVETPPPKLWDGVEWTSTELLEEEASAIGFYFSGHPLDDYIGALKRKRVLTYSELAATAGRGYTGRIAGVVVSKRERKSQKGNPFAFVQFSDPTGMFEAVVFSETLAASRELLEPGSAVVLAVEAEKVEDQVKMRIEGVEPVDKAVAGAAARGLRVFVSDVEGVDQTQSQLAACNAQPRAGVNGAAPRGCGPINLVLAPADEAMEAELALPGYYPVNPSIVAALKAAPRILRVEEF
ncbi:MAG: DNA polymerase III subunit alpha [Neomegalonema sp.]|nr:DNA polymerase III subunit alpha [Neomegalonema sp.]